MMDQTHIGYTTWQEPPLNAMPAVTEVQIPEAGFLSLTAEGGMGFRPSLGTLDSVAQHTRAIQLLNRGKVPVGYRVTTSAPWIVVDRTSGTVESEQSIDVPYRLEDGSGRNCTGIGDGHSTRGFAARGRAVDLSYSRRDPRKCPRVCRERWLCSDRGR
jgi:hypothetical protein